MSCPVLIYGAGGFAREVEWLLREVMRQSESTRGSSQPIAFPAGFIVDTLDSGTPKVHDLPVFTLEVAKQMPGAAYVVAVGSPGTREKLAAKADAAGLTPFSAAVHPSVLGDLPHRLTFGDGTIVCAGSIFTTDIQVGRHVIVNLDCTIGHDVVMHDFVTLAPGVHISGNVTIERGAEIGTGAVIRQGLTIGAGSMVGMGSVVTKPVPAGETWVGNPARKLERN